MSTSVNCLVASVKKSHALDGGIQPVKRSRFIYQNRPLRASWHDLVAEVTGEDSQRCIEGCRTTLESIQY
jgi:hypothetical protein